MRYTPHTKEDVQFALETIGLTGTEDLFADIPDELRNPALELPDELDETELLEHMRELAAKNVLGRANFLGGGMRKHFVPSVVNALTFQSEFVTAYTPYQPEVSQGLLQAMFEYQSMIAALTELECSNSGLYDGATAVAEAALLAMRQTNGTHILVSRGVHPEYRATLETFIKSVGGSVHVLDLENGTTQGEKIAEIVRQHEASPTAAVIVQQPNFLGLLEDMDLLTEVAQSAGALMIAAVDPLSLGVLKPPGAYGAEIAVGDGQVIGNAMNFGGPSFGFIAVQESLVRQLPGRLVGATRDVDGRRGFVLTLQAREQHIRRAKAKSNICTNHALMSLQSTIHLAALGPEGLREAATASVVRARELENKVCGLGLEKIGDTSFNEFAVRLPKDPREIRRSLAERGIHACVPVPNEYDFGFAGLFAATECTSEEEIDLLARSLKEVCA